MTVSCIIPCYNSGSTITRSVRSVLAQTTPVQNIVIIDDGSDSATKNILNELQLESPFIKIITQENKGVSAARNEGLRHCSSDYILMLDADDFFEPGYLEKALPILEADDNLAMTMCFYTIKTSGEKDIPRELTNASFKDYLFRNYGMNSGLYRRKAILDSGGYDEAMLSGYEDWDLLIRLKKNRWDFFVIPEYLFKYSNLPHSRNKYALKQDSEIKKYIFLKYKEDYIRYYHHLIEHFTALVSNRNATIHKREQSLNFKIGKSLLAPIRKVKSWFT